LRREIVVFAVVFARSILSWRKAGFFRRSTKMGKTESKSPLRVSIETEVVSLPPPVSTRAARDSRNWSSSSPVFVVVPPVRHDCE
jgi:hypothetical protein